jgi:hypothetical protein
MEHVSTKNLGEAAYLYALGLPFSMRVVGNTRVTVNFDGPNSEASSQDYYSGAKIEAVKLIEAYKIIKIKTYEALNKEPKRSNKSWA